MTGPPDVETGRSRVERQRQKAGRKAAEERHRRWQRLLRTASRLGLVVVILGVVAAGVALWLSRQTVLPPTTMENHVEVSPRAHILSEPMPVEIQKHMLEHADGGGPPGVIVQYNCQKFTCPPTLVDALTRIAKDYPAFVYLAPNPTMDARIALTRLGRILVLEEADADRIRRFIQASGT